MTSVDQALQEVTTAYQSLCGAVAAAEALRGPYVHALREQFESWLRMRAAELGCDMDGTLGRALGAWSAPVWSGYQPPGPDEPIVTAVRLGAWDVPTAATGRDLPALAPLIGHGHLFFRGQDAEATRELLESTALRLVLTCPPGMLRLTLFDPVTVGGALAAFLRLPPSIRGRDVAFRPEEVDAGLKALEDHVADVNRRRLTNVYDDIEAYNAAAGAVKVPYRLVVFADLPAAVEPRSWSRLMALAHNGPRAGVYLAATINAQYELPRDANLEELLATGTTVDVEGRIAKTVVPPLDQPSELALDEPPDATVANDWLKLLGQAAEDAASAVDFGRLQIPEGQRWRGDSSDGLAVPVGVTASGEPWTLEIGRTGSTCHLALIVGIIRSGKSNLLHVLIMQLALRYAPEELELYLLDFKEGVGFQPYMRLPHARAVALESEREFALSILEHLQADMISRGDLFKGAASGALEQYPDYRRQTSRALPRKLLIIDEFQVLFREDDRLAQEAERLLTDLAKRGAAFGINFVLCSQSLSLEGRSGKQIYNMMDLRLALRCVAQDSIAAIGTEAASKLEQPGEVLLNTEPGVHRVALLSVEERREVLALVTDLAADRAYPAPITFDSRASAELRDNTDLDSLLKAKEWPDRDPKITLWLGEPVALGPVVAATLERYLRMNLLVAGGREEEAYGLMAAALVSLAAQRAPADGRFVVADFSRSGSPIYGSLAGLAELLPHGTQFVGPREAAALPGQLVAELDKRLGGNADTDVYVLVAGLHRWRELRSADPFEPSAASLALARIADEGPEVGMHLIVWADGAATVEKALKRGALGSFDMRAVLRVSEGDSQDLLGSNVAAKLGDNRGLFRNEDWELGRMVKFKPYVIPGDDEVTQAIGRLSERGC